MPDQSKNPPNYPVIFLVVASLFAIVMMGLYLKSPNNKLQNLVGSGDPNLKQKVTVPKGEPQQTFIYEGYVQGIVPQKKNPSDVEYTYLVGLIDRSGEPVPVWITNQEFTMTKFYDSGTGTRKPITVQDIKGADFLRVTKTTLNGVTTGIVVDRFK